MVESKSAGRPGALVSQRVGSIGGVAGVTATRDCDADESLAGVPPDSFPEQPTRQNTKAIDNDRLFIGAIAVKRLLAADEPPNPPGA